MRNGVKGKACRNRTRKQEDIYSIQSDIQRILTEYREKGTPVLLTDAVRLQMGALKDVVHQLRLLKYDVMYMEGDRLVQHPVAFDKPNINWEKILV